MTFDERIVTKASPAAAFSFLSNVRNLPAWDPGVTHVEQIIAGPVGLGSKFRVTMRRLGIKAVFDYHVETCEPDYRVVLFGKAHGVTATDTALVTPYHEGSRVHWKAEIHLVFPLMLVDPVVAWLLGPGIRGAVANLNRELDRLALPQASSH